MAGAALVQSVCATTPADTNRLARWPRTTRARIDRVPVRGVSVACAFPGRRLGTIVCFAICWDWTLMPSKDRRPRGTPRRDGRTVRDIYTDGGALHRSKGSAERSADFVQGCAS